MNRQLKSFCDEFNLQTKGKSLVYGSILGYQFACSYDGSLNCNFFTFMTAEAQQSIKMYLDTIVSLANLNQYTVNANKISYSTGKSLSAKDLNSVISVTTMIANYLKEKSFPDERFCPLDGKEMSDKKLIFFGGTYPCYVTAETATALKLLEDPQADLKNSPANYGRSIIGTLIGALLGSAVWVFFASMLGMICGWLSFLIAILAGFGYYRSNGKQSGFRILITSTVALFVFLLTLFLIYIVLVKQILIEKNIDAGIFDFLQMLLRQDEEFRYEFIFNTLLSFAFGLSGIGFTIFFFKSSTSD